MVETIKADKEIFIELLEKILNEKIENLEFDGIEHFDTITEYKFSLFKINLIFSNGQSEEIYLKIIKGGKIKESIFCYWSLLYEEYLKENKDKNDKILKKVIITQKTANESNSSIVLNLEQNLDYYAEINLVELKKFAIENNRLERWGEDLEIKSEDILFIGRKKY
jgi:hypothetical protein